MKTVGIIGAGPAGLCAIKYCLAFDLSPVAWEHGSSLGGTWKYTDSVGKDEYGYPIHSSMYKNLRTDIPKEILAFPDFPFPEEDECFVHHTHVLSYLEMYAVEFKLTPYIKFSHHVNNVEPIFEEEEKPPCWKVTTENLKTGELFEEIVDFVLICNGHFSKPVEPFIECIEKFAGIQLHSHSYRNPEDYIDKTVAVLGMGPSGRDIAIELCDVAHKVYLCHNFPVPVPSAFPSNMFQRKGIVEAQENGFILKDKSFIEADMVLYCTGYAFDFPFLSPQCKIRIENNQVRPLYNQVLHSEYPSMGFPGLLSHVLTFPMFDIQIRYLLSIFSEKITIPTSAQMNLETERAMLRFTYEGNDQKKYFLLFNRQLNYMKKLLDTIHHQYLPPFYEKYFKVTILRGLFRSSTVRKYKYEIMPDGGMKETLNGVEVATNWNLPAVIFFQIVKLSMTNFKEVSHCIFSFVWNRIKVLIFDVLSSMGACDNYL